MSGPTRQDLYDLDSAWGGAEEPAGGDFESVPDGTYEAKVRSAEMRYTKESRKPMISLALIVTGGDFAGRWLWKHIVLSADPRSMGFVKRDLAYLGLGPERISDIPDLLDSCVGRLMVVKAQMKKGFQNVYFQHDEVPAASPSESSIDDDELPF